MASLFKKLSSSKSTTNNTLVVNNKQSKISDTSNDDINKQLLVTNANCKTIQEAGINTPDNASGKKKKSSFFSIKSLATKKSTNFNFKTGLSKSKSKKTDKKDDTIYEESDEDAELYSDASDIGFDSEEAYEREQIMAGRKNTTMTKEQLMKDCEELDMPTFLYTPNADKELIDETRRLLIERHKNCAEAFYEHDYQRMLNDDWTVTRFLLRCRLDPKRSAKLMEECGKFRRQYQMSGIELYEFPIEFHKVGSMFCYEKDRVGNVTMYMRAKMYRRIPEINEVMKSFILAVMEHCDTKNNGRGVAVVFDLTSCGIQNVDLSFLAWLLSSFRNYCPKGLSYILVYNLPWFLNATCRLAMSWMSTNNRRALRFAKGKEIEQFIARENLPDYMGGTCKTNYRAIPAGSRPAEEVCESINLSKEDARRFIKMYRKYLCDENGVEYPNEFYGEIKEKKVETTYDAIVNKEKFAREQERINKMLEANQSKDDCRNYSDSEDGDDDATKDKSNPVSKASRKSRSTKQLQQKLERLQVDDNTESGL